MNIFRKKSGFSIMEGILSAALFIIIVGALAGAILYGQESTALAGARARATLLAQEGLEAVRNMRDEDFGNLVDGTYGLAVQSNQYVLSGSQDITDIFTRQITISTISANTKKVTSTVTWLQNAQRIGTVALNTYLTDWRLLFNQADNLVIEIEDAGLGGPQQNNLVGLEIQNIGSFDITIDKIIPNWTKTNQNIKAIVIGGTLVWSFVGPGSPANTLPSGTLIDIQDFILAPGNEVHIDYFEFTGNMKDSGFDITFIMADGTQKSTGSFLPQEE